MNGLSVVWSNMCVIRFNLNAFESRLNQSFPRIFKTSRLVVGIKFATENSTQVKSAVCSCRSELSILIFPLRAGDIQHDPRQKLDARRYIF